MKSRLHWNSVHRVRQNGLGMAMYDTVDMRESFVDLAMNEALLIALFGLRVNWRAVGYIVLDEI